MTDCELVDTGTWWHSDGWAARVRQYSTRADDCAIVLCNADWTDAWCCDGMTGVCICWFGTGVAGRFCAWPWPSWFASTCRFDNHGVAEWCEDEWFPCLQFDGASLRSSGDTLDSDGGFGRGVRASTAEFGCGKHSSGDEEFGDDMLTVSS